MTEARLALTRARILAHRLRVSALDERLPAGARSLRRAAWAGLSDSMPRGALLSIHARVADTRSDAWEDPALVQVWGPRFSAYVVPAEDRAVFTLGRMPDEPAGLARAVSVADELERFLAGRRMSYAEAGHAMGVDPNSLRYGTTTGRILIRWEGARRPLIWTVPAPEMTRRTRASSSPGGTSTSWARGRRTPSATGPGSSRRGRVASSTRSPAS